MKNFKHLSKTQRCQLETLLKAKVSKKEIAIIIGVHISTVYREIKRGEYDHKVARYDMYGFNKYVLIKRYSSDKSEIRYRENLKNKGRSIKLGKDYEYANFLEFMIIHHKYSPKAVLKYIERNNLEFNTKISVNTLYKYIERGYFSHLDLKHLPEKGKSKPHIKREILVKKAPKGNSIERRPLEVSNRNTFGHWEMDLLCGSSKKSLLVLTERLSRKEIIIPLSDKTSNSVIKALNNLEHHFGKQFKKVFKTITVDNGSEFSNAKGIEKSIYKGNRTTVYYCHPYCSCERGSNERMNREIRRMIPKGSDLGKFSKNEIKEIENWLNNYPRKVLDYYCANEIFEREMKKIA